MSTLKILGVLISLTGISALPAHSSVFIKPVYQNGQAWTGNARVSFWNDGKEGVVIKYPVLDGCFEAKDYMVSAKAGSPGAGLFGRHQTMSWKEVNKLILELSNSRPLGSHDTNYRNITRSLRAVPYPSRPFDCGPSRTNPFPGWN